MTNPDDTPSGILGDLSKKPEPKGITDPPKKDDSPGGLIPTAPKKPE